MRIHSDKAVKDEAGDGESTSFEILETSQVPEFDALVLKTAPLLELPPPDETLVREPPYVVVVQVAP